MVFTGTGTAGAYHAGVLRALQEAAVKVDLVAGRGVGAAAAMFAVVDGGARLWDDAGVWRGSRAAMYRWRLGLRAAAWALATAVAVLLSPLALLGAALPAYLGGLGLTLVGLDAAGAALTAGYARLLAFLFAPGALPTIVPRLVVLALGCGLAALLAGSLAAAAGGRARRRARGPFWARLVGAPMRATDAVERFSGGLWDLLRGAAALGQPPPGELGRRYVEVLAENLGQPGFRELVLIAHDFDARRDLVFALLQEPHRRRFFTPRPGDGERRQADTVDLAGAGRDHALDALAGAVSLPVFTEPGYITFAPESYWRGETHRLCDRPDALGRLLDELALAGVEQLVLVSGWPDPAGPHTLSSGRDDLRGRAGEYVAALETAAVRDALRMAARRFAGIFRVRPAHNPLGPFDFAGCYDERSDRRQTLAELVDRGYEDAYRQFIEPVVGASGERLQAAGRLQAPAPPAV